MRILSGSQTRQLIDSEQAYLAFRAAQREYRQRFTGAMTWKGVGSHQYLYRKKEGIWRSLGPRSPETERVYEQFRAGRAKLKARRKSLDEAIRAMAPINRAMRLGRVPWTSARILRRLERAGLLGEGLRVAGTHALYAYERMGGVHFHSQTVTTADIDLLRDSRAVLSFTSSDVRDASLMELLRRIDASFEPAAAGSFRAVNDKGFMVDLITPALRNPARPIAAEKGNADDLTAVEIEGLAWLENSRAVEQVVIDERGYPLTVIAPDPRAFALHKAWLARRDDRDPAKRRRNAAQAEAVVEMLLRFQPHLGFDDPALKAFPATVRKLGAELVKAGKKNMTRDPASWDGE
jgi:hypothetical protein